MNEKRALINYYNYTIKFKRRQYDQLNNYNN